MLRWEWLLFELAVIGFGIFELISLNRYKRQERRSAAEEADKRDG